MCVCTCMITFHTCLLFDFSGTSRHALLVPSSDQACPLTVSGSECICQRDPKASSSPCRPRDVESATCCERLVPMELLPEESVEPAHSGKGNIEISGVVDLRGRPLCPYERAPSNPHCDAPSLVATVYIFLNFGIAFKAVGRSLT